MNGNTIITIVMCFVILVFGIIDLVYLIKNALDLGKIYNKFDREIKKTQIVYEERMNNATGQMSKYNSRKVWYDIGRLNENRDNYNDVYASYVATSQFVSVFPLLGILGTVSGLVFGGSLDDIETLYEGLSMALFTTFIGLICAIVLKIFDLLWAGKLISLIDSEFDDAESAIHRQIVAGEAERERALRWTNK